MVTKSFAFKIKRYTPKIKGRQPYFQSKKAGVETNSETAIKLSNLEHKFSKDWELTTKGTLGRAKERHVRCPLQKQWAFPKVSVHAPIFCLESYHSHLNPHSEDFRWPSLYSPVHHCCRSRDELPSSMTERYHNKVTRMNTVKDCLRGSFPENPNPFYTSPPLEKVGSRNKFPKDQLCSNKSVVKQGEELSKHYIIINIKVSPWSSSTDWAMSTLTIRLLLGRLLLVQLISLRRIK